MSAMKLDRCAALPGRSGAAALLGLCADSLPPSSGRRLAKSLPGSDPDSFRNGLRVRPHTHTRDAGFDLLPETLAEDSA